ncbi:MAG: hypothetical protein UHX00_04910 [Caryophanon sp.]|nr:hypothetical protein [Caryophanon sp.]
MEHSVTSINIGDVIATTIMLGLSIIPIIILFLLYRAYKRNVKRAEQRLQLEKQQTLHLQQQVDSLQARVENIELLLKEVD